MLLQDCAVIFDCDGVLVDSEPVSCAASILTLREYGVVTDAAEMELMIGKSYQTMLEFYEERDRRSFDLAEFTQRVEQNYFTLAEALQPMPGVAGLLAALTERGIPLAVASSGGCRKIEFSLEKTGLRPYLPVICSAVDVAHGKPEPDLFLYAAERLEQPPARCIVVEDSIYGIIAAKRAGMLAVGYLSSFPAERLREAGADCLLKDFSEFFGTLKYAGIL
ncbi:HAD superfamily hydrolase (TIGR01509 family)/HAD superfamily hydrolase (TIGR01549 family) [Hydrogenispora ethanolica]|uniref:HAD superfamily hydrolase (TIGR01509 family)/HAD superfamily hydrolase (TIGR01549 family) n=1 Tax=Hydrogenispora ethanolica TaxID=1082276 RepID=A0A4R1RR57_HYDET|nr:HAD family phosphatase [Hydrogenispora ethanolica]TCL68500.1 HAD superfamily hydrolase (TIGR01509 family)/HAD superfamily hydrolase (TIGR01549 family) [Hydrogenispora ethanolica]